MLLSVIYAGGKCGDLGLRASLSAYLWTDQLEGGLCRVTWMVCRGNLALQATLYSEVVRQEWILKLSQLD